MSQLLWVIKTQIEKYYGSTSVKSENHQNQHAYLQCIYRNIQQSKVLENVEGVIKYLNAVPGMYHSMDSIASLYDIEIDKCLENWRKINISPYLLLFTKQLTMRWRSAYRHKVKKKSIHFESFKEHKNWWHITHSAQKLVTKITQRDLPCQHPEHKHLWQTSRYTQLSQPLLLTQCHPKTEIFLRIKMIHQTLLDSISSAV